ncbi:hypothetical protein V7147_07365, partial [Bacillus sp. JJ1521]|uniref:hypothetical protein n=1 Tax=Bacillus sp. JJ1521 TaxID=3122957 RepID=UPI002FFDBF55
DNKDNSKHQAKNHKKKQKKNKRKESLSILEQKDLKLNTNIQENIEGRDSSLKYLTKHDIGDDSEVWKTIRALLPDNYKIPDPEFVKVIENFFKRNHKN